MPGKMSSDIDEEEDYSSIDERDPKAVLIPAAHRQQQQLLLPPRARQQQQQQLQQIHQLQQLQQQQPQLEDVGSPTGGAGTDPIDMEHQNAAAYVNLNEAKLSLDLNGDGTFNGGGGSLKSSTRRDKSK